MMAQKSIMWAYMAEEEAVLHTLLQDPSIEKTAQAFCPKVKSICFVAHGSSYNAAVSTAGFIARTAGVRTSCITPANFLYNNASLLLEDRDTALVVAISQTGTSSGVLSALREAKRLGFQTLGITDVASSPMAAEPDRVLFLRCGEEDSNAKTKGYSATLLLLMRFGIHLGLTKGAITKAHAQELLRELESQIGALRFVQEQVLAWCGKTGFGDALRDFYVLSSGMNFGTAMEGQLKLMETACIPTMFNDIGEFSHGMHRSITPESTVLLLKTAGPFASLTEETFRYLRGITPHVLLLDASGSLPEEPGRVLLPAHPLTQSLLLFTRAVQVLSVFGPERQGLDPNRDAHNDFTEVVHTRV